MDRDLQTILLRDNPWLADSGRLASWLRSRMPDDYLPRTIDDRSHRRWREINRAHLVIGPRQAGKSTTLWNHLARLGEPALFIDCEQQLVQQWCRSAPLFLDELEGFLPRPVTLFFEEVQHLDEAGLFFKGLADRKVGVPLLVTGSSSFHLGARTRESLAGRATRTRLLPFSLAEVCADLEAKPAQVRSRLAEDRLARHLLYGGYPEVWRSDSPEKLLTDLVEAVILRDASDLFSIGRPDAFRRLLRLLASQTGSLVNLSEWSSILGVNRDTAASYLEILESGHVAAVLSPFAGGRRSELTRSPKAYLLDNGIRNRLLHDFKPPEYRADRGAIIENWVFSELWKLLPDGATLHFWRSTSKAEVDFVAVRGERIVALEVKSQTLRRSTVPRACRSFVAAYEPRLFLIVNAGLEHRETVGKTELKWVSFSDFQELVRRALEE